MINKSVDQLFFSFSQWILEDETKPIYIHGSLKFESKRLVHFLDGHETWDIIVLFVFVDRIKVKTQSKEGSRTFNLPMKSTESLNGGKGKWDHSPTSSSPSQRWETTPLIIFYIGQRGKLAFSSPTICCWHHSSPANSRNHKWKFLVRFWTTFSNPDSNSTRTKLSSLVQCIVQAVIISTSCHH